MYLCAPSDITVLTLKFESYTFACMYPMKILSKYLLHIIFFFH